MRLHLIHVGYLLSVSATALATVPFEARASEAEEAAQPGDAEQTAETGPDDSIVVLGTRETRMSQVGSIAGLLHVIDVAGVDHVCLGADWDGGGGIVGLEDITAHPKITVRLKAAGNSDDDLAEMWSGNVQRILRAADDNVASSR